MTLFLYIVAGLLLAILSGLIAVGLLIAEENGGLWVMSETWMRERGWWRR